MKKQILFFIAAFLVTLLLCEVFIQTSRLASVSYTEFYKDIGRGRRKNFNYILFNEGLGIGRFNEYRYSGENNPPEKDKNTIRIILMGDSYVEALQVFERHYFGNIAEDFMKEKFPGYNFEFLNFGRSGFDIANIYAYQKTFADNFNPDFILYMITRGDLISKNEDPLRPEVKLEQDSLIVDLDFSESEISLFEKTKPFLQYSSILNMLNNGRKKAESIPFAAILLGKVYTWFQKSDVVRPGQESNEVYRINPVTKEIVQSVDSSKVIFINRGFSELPGEFNELCHESGVKLFDLSQSLDSMRKSGTDPVEWPVTNKYGHWNQMGHRLVGREISGFLSDILKDKFANCSKRE